MSDTEIEGAPGAAPSDDAVHRRSVKTVQVQIPNKIGIIWIGANDLLTSFKKTGLVEWLIAHADNRLEVYKFVRNKVVSLLNQAINPLIDLGYRRIVIFNQPPFNVTPEFTLGNVDRTDGYIIADNPFEPGISVFDVHDWMDRTLNFALRGQFAEAGITGDLLRVYRDIIGPHRERNKRKPAGPNSDAYMSISLNEICRFLNTGTIRVPPQFQINRPPVFFDSLHPSSLVHRLLANEVYRLIRAAERLELEQRKGRFEFSFGPNPTINVPRDMNWEERSIIWTDPNVVTFLGNRPAG